MDLLMTDRWLIPLMFPEDNLPDSEKDEPLNQFFDENGFHSKTLVKNLGSSFVYMNLLVFILFFIPVTKLLSRSSEK